MKKFIITVIDPTTKERRNYFTNQRTYGNRGAASSSMKGRLKFTTAEEEIQIEEVDVISHEDASAALVLVRKVLLKEDITIVNGNLEVLERYINEQTKVIRR